ncbi:hypothetical protein [Actinoplanes subtropicus]|uniref:hypothetical protein n=1 Tax=Actinoplanes subtropicus TaxID=543632 RepID=UPI0004C3DEA0|nr:hypothetical protein [Actinoplanes subtropicus]
MALGLPIAVAAGWTLATPARKPTEVSAPAGTGGIGAGGSDGIGRAPHRPGIPQPLTAVQLTPRPTATATLPPVTAPSGAPMPTSAAPTAVEASTVSLPPVLNEPPVPTPTEITEMPSPSATPSAPPSASPSTNP